MTRRKKVKFVHEGQFVARVEIEVLEDHTGWSPYISTDDAFKLDGVREALRHGDLKAASKYGRIYELRPVKPSVVA